VPEVVHSDAWATSLRQQTRGLARGWTVEEARGKVRLKVRPDGQPSESISLPFVWGAASAGDAYVRIRNLYALVQEGYTLKQAALVADGKAPKLTEQQDWPGALERFKQQKLQHGTAIKAGTWEAKYSPVLANAVAMLTSNRPPTSPADLIDRCISNWEPGSRTRQERARNLCQFLRHCVNREQFPVIWQPPTDLKDAIGRKPATATSQKSDELSDQQIIDLIDSLPDDDAGRRWADALKLLAELGLRPIELLHLSIRTDSKTKERFWWCSYEKRAGGGVTKPRRLYPLPLQADDGTLQNWKLLESWPLKMPPLQSGNGAADAIGTYLNRRAAWKALRAEQEAAGKRVSGYAFRHSYSLRGHQRSIDTGSMALAMGHSIEVHCRSYTWASESTTSAAFARAAQMISAV
jgi:integrase